MYFVYLSLPMMVSLLQEVGRRRCGGPANSNRSGQAGALSKRAVARCCQPHYHHTGRPIDLLESLYMYMYVI